MFSLKYLLPTLLASPYVFSATPDQWRGRSIYQVVTDRFATADNDSASCDTSTRKYCGGSWKGIANHLDYIQAMGFDAVWISPIVENLEGQTAYGEAYHGYWTKDINNINTHFGSEDDLKGLSSALHSRGMYLMVDIVVNHLVALPTNNSGGQTVDYSSLAPFSSQSEYHPYCEISDYSNQTAVEQCWLGDKALPLADLNTEDPSIVKTMNDWVSTLVKTYQIDGLRIDTVKHVRKDFWPDFAKSAGVFTLGEILSDNVTYTKDYTEVIDGVLDYPNWFPLTAAFTSSKGNLSALVDTAVRSQSAYKNGAFAAGSFLENHDQPRFQSITQDQALVKNAMMWPFINDAIPILYYGQEQGYTGSGDPNNREALWLTAFETQKPLVNHVKALNAARKSAITSNDKFLSTPMTFVSQSSAQAIAVSKPPLLGLLTNVGSSSSTTWTVGADAKLFKSGESLLDVLSCKTVNADDQGGITVKSNGGMPQLLIPMSAWNKTSGVCGSNINSAINSAEKGSVRGAWVQYAAAAITLGVSGYMM